MTEEGTLCGQPDVEKYAGTKANATSVAEAYTNVYIKEAEGVIAGILRFDVVTNYTNFNSTSKELLREAAAVYAAIGVIAYDMSGYTSRIEAENMINICWAKWRTIRKIILDQKWLTFAKT